MTDSLVSRLRALADDCKRARQTSFAEGPDYEVTEEALREAADALDLCQTRRDAYNAGWMEEIRLRGDNLLEIDAIKAKLATAEQRLARRAEHPSNAEKLADRVRVYKGKARRQKERAEKAEAEAAALRSALQGILEGSDQPAVATKAYVKLVLSQPRSLLEQEPAVLREQLRRAEEAHSKDLAVDNVTKSSLLIERNEARAEAAALRDALDTYAQFSEQFEIAIVSGYLAKRALSQPGPGAELLQELQELRAFKQKAEAR